MEKEIQDHPIRRVWSRSSDWVEVARTLARKAKMSGCSLCLKRPNAFPSDSQFPIVDAIAPSIPYHSESIRSCQSVQLGNQLASPCRKPSAPRFQQPQFAIIELQRSFAKGSWNPIATRLAIELQQKVLVRLRGLPRSWRESWFCPNHWVRQKQELAGATHRAGLVEQRAPNLESSRATRTEESRHPA